MTDRFLYVEERTDLRPVVSSVEMPASWKYGEKCHGGSAVTEFGPSRLEELEIKAFVSSIEISIKQDSVH